jgi:arylsulfatase A-like enzyme
VKNKNRLSRRDFLKLAFALPASFLVSPSLRPVSTGANSNRPNIIILVFDAWSVHNMSLFGYSRDTAPNISKFTEKATVYHNHLAGGTFTVSGTASLLTGLYPWSHRALQLGSDIAPHHEDHQIFASLVHEYSTTAYAQNPNADQFLSQSRNYLDTHIRTGAFNAQNRFIYGFFKNDPRIAFASFEDNIIQRGVGYDASFFLGPTYRLRTLHERYLVTEKYWREYPRGVPGLTEVFLLDDVVDGAINVLKGLTGANLLYMHFYPPHEPYAPKEEFWGKFKGDGWKPKDKAIHPLSDEKNRNGETVSNRRFYDEFIASWDHEVGRLFEYLNSSGLLENSYVFITSDHGELFERGEIGHFSPLMYDPLMHIPLIISRQGQTQREDVYANTSNVDILPTLAHITGNPIPEWAEGELLPGLGGTENVNRGIYTIDAKTNSAFAPLRKFSVSLTRDRYRLTHYSYPNYENFEFYDLSNDPEEMDDLFPQRPSVAVDMQNEILDKLADVNRPYTD